MEHLVTIDSLLQSQSVMVRTKARKQLSTRTPLGLLSGLLVLLTHKTDVFSIYCCGLKFARGSEWHGDRTVTHPWL